MATKLSQHLFDRLAAQRTKLETDLQFVKSINTKNLKLTAKLEKELKATIRDLRAEVEELKQEAVETMNDRAEVVGKLRARINSVLPEGWTAVSYSKDNEATIYKHQAGWSWIIYTETLNEPHGDASTLAGAVAAVDKAQKKLDDAAAKRKKARK